jgi:hypothetical protein
MENASKPAGPCGAVILFSEKILMKRIVSSFVSLAFVCTFLLGSPGSVAAQQRSDRQMRDAIRTLNSQVADLQYDIEFEGKNNGGGSQMKAAWQGLDELADKIVVFEDNVLSRRENRDDVDQIATAARKVDVILKSADINRAIADKWSSVKQSVDSLTRKYNGPSNWGSRSTSTMSSTMSSGVRVIPPPSTRTNAPTRANPSTGNSSTGINGTYELDVTRTENVSDAILNSNVAGAEKVELESRLEAPQQIAIQVRGNQVTLASSKAPPVTFIADGREKVENTGGRTIKFRATMRGQDLIVSSLGDETDYTVTFSPSDDGRTLKVTRRITTEYISETIIAESVYNRTDTVARLGVDREAPAPVAPVSSDDNETYSSTDPNDNKTVIGRSPSVVTPRIGEFVVPNGSVITGLLENPIDTKVSQNNDRFRMTVQSPDQFRGAIVEGYISGVGRSGQISGRSNVTFNFTKITLRDGKSYDFAGTLQSIRDAYGKDVKVDAEGIAKSDSQTRETVKRGGIGAGAGALIGAIFGGGKGAAIGAIVGGGAGAGSVIVQGREDIRLQQGSILTVISSSPIRRDQQVIDN